MNRSEHAGSCILRQGVPNRGGPTVGVFILWIYKALNPSPIIDCYCMGVVPNLSVCISVYLSVCPSVVRPPACRCLAVCLRLIFSLVHLCYHAPMYLVDYVSIYPSICLPIEQTILCIYPYIHPIRLSVYRFVRSYLTSFLVSGLSASDSATGRNAFNLKPYVNPTPRNPKRLSPKRP